MNISIELPEDGDIKIFCRRLKKASAWLTKEAHWIRWAVKYDRVVEPATKKDAPIPMIRIRGKDFEKHEKARKKMKIKMAPMKKVDASGNRMNLILKALGHPEALVTDLSCLSDFSDAWEPDKKWKKRLAVISKKLGVGKLTGRELLVNVAKKIKPAIDL